MTVTANQTGAFTGKGAQDAAQKTYASVKAALEAHQNLKTKNVEIFLQGSYANDTNIRGDSDVDIVVMLPRTFSSDTTRLNTVEKTLFDKHWSPAIYTSKDLRRDVIKALKSHYGEGRVEEKNKCIRIHKKDGYVDADVVPAIQHRLYRGYIYSPGDFIEGTAIDTLKGDRIINYPKEHKKNGATKNFHTIGKYKPTVRQIKNLKRHAVQQGVLDPKDAPGYMLECMAYNVPVNLFESHDHLRLARVMMWLLEANFEKFTSADEVHTLFHTDPGKFSASSAKRILTTLSSQVSWT